MRTRWEALVAGDFEIPVNNELGFEIQPVDDPRDGVVYKWKVPPELCNSAGNLQGGILAAFADSVLGGACAAHISEDLYPALAEMKISFLRPARSGTTITGSARVLKVGKRLLFVEGEVTGEDGELIAKVSGTEVPAPAP